MQQVERLLSRLARLLLSLPRIPPLGNSILCHCHDVFCLETKRGIESLSFADFLCPLVGEAINETRHVRLEHSQLDSAAGGFFVSKIVFEAGSNLVDQLILHTRLDLGHRINYLAKRPI